MNTSVKAKPMGTLDKLRALKSPTNTRIEQIQLDELIPDPNQPRSRFRPVDGKVDPEVLSELREFADDLDQNGQLQPILYRIVDGQKMIIAGERRWRGKKLNRELGRPNSDTIDAILRQDLTADKLRLAQLAENLQRDDLTDIETAVYIKNLLEEFPDLKKKDISTVFNKKSQYVSRILAMLDPQWDDVISSGAIQFASLLEQFRPLPVAAQEELKALAAKEGRALTSGDIRAAKARFNDTPEKVVELVQAPADVQSGGAQNAGVGVPASAPGGSAGPADQGSKPLIDEELANEVSNFIASSAPQGENYKPSASASNAPAPREQKERLHDTGGDAVIPKGPGALSPTLLERREVKITVDQLERLLAKKALQNKGHQVSITLPVDEIKQAIASMGGSLPEDDNLVVMNLLEAVNKL